MKSRNWCFTFNNPSEEPSGWCHDNIKFLAYQRECGLLNTEHYQGYLELKTPRDMITLKRAFGDSIHWETRMGTRAQALRYVTKKSTRVSTPIIMHRDDSGILKLVGDGEEHFDIDLWVETYLSKGGSKSTGKELDRDWETPLLKYVSTHKSI